MITAPSFAGLLLAEGEAKKALGALLQGLINGDPAAQESLREYAHGNDTDAVCAVTEEYIDQIVGAPVHRAAELLSQWRGELSVDV